MHHTTAINQLNSSLSYHLYCLRPFQLGRFCPTCQALLDPFYTQYVAVEYTASQPRQAAHLTMLDLASQKQIAQNR